MYIESYELWWGSIKIMQLKTKFFNLMMQEINEWIVCSRNLSWEGSITIESFELSLTTLSCRRFHSSPSHRLLSESPSRSSVLRLYPGCLRILMVTSPLFIVLVVREGNQKRLATLQFISGQWFHLIQWEWGNVRFTY